MQLEKNLYWGWAGKDIVFGSELKALRKHPNFTKKISSEALSHFFQFMYVPVHGAFILAINLNQAHF